MNKVCNYIVIDYEQSLTKWFEINLCKKKYGNIVPIFYRNINNSFSFSMSVSYKDLYSELTLNKELMDIVKEGVFFYQKLLNNSLKM